jgi:hypothetical protein
MSVIQPFSSADFPATPEVSNDRDWKLFCLILVAAYFCRGLILCCILPPLEMWDEYQHIGRIVYLHENGRSPVYLNADVPASLMEKIVQYPQPALAQEQMTESGALTYKEFWLSTNRPKFMVGSPLPRLYEAQQGPAYYWLMLPIMDAAGGTNHLTLDVSVLRLVNVGFGAATLAIVLFWARRSCREKHHAMVIGLWAGLHPLLLLNSARVANDSLALLLAVLVVVWALSLDREALYWYAAGIGALTGIGILTKATDLALFPFVIYCFLRVGIRKQAKWMNVCVAASIFLMVALGETMWTAIDSFHRYGVAFPMQEAVLNHANGVKAAAFLSYLRPNQWKLWWDLWNSWFVSKGLWEGGWSFLMPPRLFVRAYKCFLLMALLGWPIAWLYGRERPGVSSIFRRSWTGAGLVVFFGLVLAEMCGHAIESLVASGECYTLGHYAAPALPWTLAVVASGALAWRHSRLGYAMALAMPAFFVLVEFFSEFDRMVKAYSQENFGLTALHRLAMLHPLALRLPTMIVATGATTVLLVLGFGICIKAIHCAGKVGAECAVGSGRRFLANETIVDPKQ